MDVVSDELSEKSDQECTSTTISVSESTARVTNNGTAEENALPADEERFLIELEFIQNLSNPKYLSYLAQNRYFQDASFMEFLKYLQYFKEPKYLRHLIFPTCLTFLDELIKNAHFRHELLSPAFIDHIHAQQGIFFHVCRQYLPYLHVAIIDNNLLLHTSPKFIESSVRCFVLTAIKSVPLLDVSDIC